MTSFFFSRPFWRHILLWTTFPVSLSLDVIPPGVTSGYFNHHVGAPATPTTSQPRYQPAPIYAAAGGGDTTRNPVPPELSNLLQDLRSDFRAEMQALKRSVQAIPSNVLSVDAEQHKRPISPPSQTSGEERYEKRGKYGEKRGPSRQRQGKQERYCRFRDEAGRDFLHTHDSDECFSHPNARLAQANRDRMAAKGVKVPRWESKKPVDDTPLPPPEATVSITNPQVRNLVDQEVIKRLAAIQHTLKSVELLKDKE